MSKYREAGGPARTLVALLFVILAYVISQIGGDARNLREGQRIQSDVTARVSFDIEDTAQTEQRREVARRLSPNVYVLNLDLLEGIRGQLNLLLNIAKENADDYAAFSDAASRAGFEVAEDAFEQLKLGALPEENPDYPRWVDSLIASLSLEYLVTPLERTALSAHLREEGEEARIVEPSLLQPADNTKLVTKIASQSVLPFPAELQPIVSRTVVHSIQIDPENKQYAPIFVYDPALTRAEAEKQIAAVKPVSNRYEAGEPLVRAGKLTERHLQLLAEEHKHYLEQRSSNEKLRRAYLLSSAGTFTLLLIIAAGLSVYVLWYEPRVVQKFGRSFGLCALLLLMLFSSRLLMLRGIGDLTVATVVLTAALLTILYNQRFALGVVSVQALWTCMVTDWQLGGLVTMVATSWLCIFLLRDIRTRSKVISVGLAAAVLGFVLTVAEGFIEQQDLRDFILPRALLTGAGILMVGFVVQGILPAIERMFGVATSVSIVP